MKNFQPATLTGGKLKTASRVKAIEKGLEHLRAGIDMLRNGMPTSKLVVLV
jgi:hypothetical protein